MIGDGKMKSSILKKIEELKLSDSVFLLPTQKDPRTALSLIDVYVTFQAGPEGFGLSFLEAMSLGKPLVISYSKGGMADFLENEKERKKISLRGQRKAHKKHNYELRMKKLLSFI